MKTIGDLIEELKKLPQDSAIAGNLFYNVNSYRNANNQWRCIQYPFKIIDANEFEKYMDYCLTDISILEHVKANPSYFKNNAND